MKKLITFVVLVLTPLLANGLENGEVVTVPEPGAFSLMFLGLAMMGAIKLKNKLKK